MFSCSPLTLKAPVGDQEAGNRPGPSQALVVADLELEVGISALHSEGLISFEPSLIVGPFSYLPDLSLPAHGRYSRRHLILIHNFIFFFFTFLFVYFALHFSISLFLFLARVGNKWSSGSPL